MSEPSSGKRRRRRPRRDEPPGSSADGRAEAAQQPRPGPASAGTARASAKRRKRSHAARPDAPERSLRDLVGAGPSQVGVSGALRARDVNRPTEQDLADAERDVVLVRRHWKPPPRGSDKKDSSANVVARE